MHEKKSAFGFCRMGKEFMDAAFAVQDPKMTSHILDSAPFTAYYLLGHAIELYLKSFLIARGTQISVLRSRPYGHDLESLLAESRRRKLGRVLKLSKIDMDLILLLNVHYKEKRLEYHVNGLYQFPAYSVISEIASRSHKGLYRFTKKITHSQYRKK